MLDWDPLPQDVADPAPSTWEDESATRTGAANAWAVLSVDLAGDLVFVPTSSPSPDFYGGERQGSNLVVGLGVFALQSAQGFGAAVPLMVIGGLLMAAYLYQGAYGLLIPGCLLLGLGLDAIAKRVMPGAVDFDAIGLGVGFVGIYVIALACASRAHWWPLIPGLVLILASLASGNVGFERLLFMIEVRQEGDTVVTTRSGNVRIEGVTGEAQVKTGSDNIELTDGHVATATLSTSSGNLTLQGIPGQLSLTTSSGNIRVRDAKDGQLTVAISMATSSTLAARQALAQTPCTARPAMRPCAYHPPAAFAYRPAPVAVASAMPSPCATARNTGGRSAARWVMAAPCRRLPCPAAISRWSACEGQALCGTVRSGRTRGVVSDGVHQRAEEEEALCTSRHTNTDAQQDAICGWPLHWPLG